VRVRATAPLATDAQPQLVTVPNVELLEVGEGWQTSTGVFTFEHEDLVAAVASQQDPGVRTPVLKLGHVDPRFDGQPSFGRVENLRLTNNGQTLVGDLVGVPLWLAASMSSAYPRRSIEGQFEYTTQTGNKWTFVLTALALLGDAYPAITTLEDVKALWGEEPPPLYPVEDVEEVVASEGAFFRARKVEEDMPSWLKRKVEARGDVQAQTSLSDVQRTFYDSLGSGQMWWWIREIRVNPLELIVDDDEGGLYRVPVEIDAQDNISFGDPAPVKVEYVAAQRGQLVAASYSDRSEAGGRDKEGQDLGATSEASGTIQSTDSGEENGMKYPPEVLQRLGLSPETPEAEVEQAILQRLSAQPTEGGDEGGAGTDGNPDSQPETPATEPQAQPAEAPATEEQPAGEESPQVPEGMVLVDAATLAEMRDGVAAARRLEQQAQERERERFLSDAVKAGKFPRARLEHYRTAWAADADGTRSVIDKLAPGLVPVEEQGAAGETDPKVEAAAYPDNWKATVAASRRGLGSRVKVVAD
jgi:hypothetical protein